MHTSKLGKYAPVVCQLVTAIALLVLHTGKLGKCAPVDDCYNSPCKAYRQAGEVCVSW